jgi:cytochrome c553
MKNFLRILMLALAASAAQSALAQGWGYGRQGPGWGGGWNKLEMCQGCHDMGMRGGMGMPMSRADTAPKLGGQHAAYLGKALKAYRSGERRHPVMNRMASMLTDRDIADIARFYSQAE